MTNRNAKTLEERVQDLEAEWDIRNLVATYLLKADTRDVEGYAETFAEDGVLDIAGLHFDKVGMEVEAIHEGREAIGKAYSQYIAPVPCFMWHLGHSPHIEVHGGSAVGRWGWTALVNIPLFGPMQAGWCLPRRVREHRRRLENQKARNHLVVQHGIWKME